MPTGTTHGATSSLIIDRSYTTLNVGSLSVDDIGVTGDLTVPGDLVIGGDLTVQGSTTILETETVRVEDKNIELGFIAAPTDTTADGGGITLLGSDNHTITYILKSPATDSTWSFSEHINLPSDKEYRINNNTVLTETTLGSSVYSSSLTEVGALDTGSISHSGTITNISVAAAAVITSTDHNLTTGNQVVITGTNSTPTINGCYTITVIDENTYSIPVTTSASGSTGSWSGNAFPIDVGLSTLSTGSHTINCEGDLSIMGENNATTTLLVDGSATTLDMANSTTQAFGSRFNSTLTGNFSGAQTNVTGTNTVNTTDISSRPVSADFTTAYTGTSTTLGNQETTLILTGGEFESTIGFQSPLVAATARGLDAKSLSTQDGINVGTISEAAGASLENTGVIGLASSDGALTIGVIGTVNNTRSNLATFIKTNWIDTGNFKAGIVGYNPSTSAGQYAYYGLGNNRFDGDTTNTGDITAEQSVIVSSDVTVGHTLFTNDIHGGGDPIRITTSDTSTGVEIATENTGVPVSIGVGGSTTTINGDLTVTGTLNASVTVLSSDGIWSDVAFSQSDYYTSESDVAWIVTPSDIQYAKIMFTGRTMYYASNISGASLTSKLDTIAVDVAGSGYTTAPVSITGGGGSGATATASLGSGMVTGISVTDPGSGYSSVPTVTVGGDGTGATATATLVKPAELRIQLPNNKSPATGQNTTFYNTLVANGGISGLGSTVVRAPPHANNEPYFNIRDSQNSGWEAQTGTIYMLQMSPFMIETSG